jgi:hypothetical protein
MRRLTLAWLRAFLRRAPTLLLERPRMIVGLPAAFAIRFPRRCRRRASRRDRGLLGGGSSRRIVRSATHGSSPALEASLDALTTRAMPSLGEAARDAALAERTRETSDVVRELSKDLAGAKGAIRPRASLPARCDELAQRRGRHRRCGNPANRQWLRSSEALVVGPLTWTPITGVGEPDFFDRADAKIESAYPTGDAFDTPAHPTLVRGRGCRIDLSAESAGAGTRDVIVDVDVPEAQTIGLVLRAHGAADLRVNGLPILDRAFELGDGEAARFARLTVDAGELRIVARAGTAKDDDSLEIDVFAANGMPLKAHAPQVGTSTRRHTLRIEPTNVATAVTDDELLLAGAAAMAAGDPRSAERGLWRVATRADARPDLALVYGRALETSRDLSPAIRAERARSAYERVLEAWPSQWEATIAERCARGHSPRKRRSWPRSFEGSGRSADESAGRLFVCCRCVRRPMASGREHLFDRAAAALARAR